MHYELYHENVLMLLVLVILYVCVDGHLLQGGFQGEQTMK